MKTSSLQPLKGFREMYPEKKVLQSYVLDRAREVARLFGFEEYDGPLLEPIELYLNKSSQELVSEQSFKVLDKKGRTFLMRPEMTPTLARMVAAKYKELILPIRYFNAGLRYRYEAPQKGRDREFYQMDFDIIGSKSEIADIEILAIVINIFKSFGATNKNFILFINSREILSKKLSSASIEESKIKAVISAIDKKDKIDNVGFIELLKSAQITDAQIDKINAILSDTQSYKREFSAILDLAKQYGIDDMLEVNPLIVRGLDYYTGIVFEAKSKGTLSRSLMGGGRYDNLIASYGSEPLGGVGFALSDSIALAFMEEFALLPNLNSVPSTILVTIFDQSTQNASLQLTQLLRQNSIKTELYPDTAAKLDKQLKYADKKQIPYVAIIGPDEAKSNTVTVKSLADRTQETITTQQLIDRFTK